MNKFTLPFPVGKPHLTRNSNLGWGNVVIEPEDGASDSGSEPRALERRCLGCIADEVHGVPRCVSSAQNTAGLPG